jgi:hypothetical protein
LEHNNLNTTDKTLENAIRQSFFLKGDFEITSEIIDAFTQSISTQNFESIIPYTQNNHTDSFNAYITHDIDWLDLHHPYSFANYLRSLLSKHVWFNAKQLWGKDALLKNIEQLLKLENELGLHATYCIGATQHSLGRFDIRYSTNSSLYQELISLITTQKQSIGLHSSYHASTNDQITRELETLKKYTSQNITAHRSHYLNGDKNILYTQLKDAGIKYELGHGMPRTVGLADHFPGKRKPINPITKEVIDLTIIPLILMDNVFFVKPYHEVIAEFKDTLSRVKEYNGSVCILFHPENMLLKPQLYNYFEEIIHICKQQGANLNTPLS